MYQRTIASGLTRKVNKSYKIISITGAHVQSICEALDVPHIEARMNIEPSSKELSINLHPGQDAMNIAYKDLMSFLNWTKVAVLYEDDYANPSSYRQVLKEIRQKEIFKLIVDTNPNHILQFFRAVLQLQMNDHRYHYMFTTFDLETFDLEDFKYNSVNITAFRIVDMDHPKSGVHGLTGNIEFNEGRRFNFKVDLLKLKKEEIMKVGEWRFNGGINITDTNAFYESQAPNITLIVMTREEKPYVMVKEESSLIGNARYEGFCIDLLKWIASQVGFQYSIRLVPDHMYGVYDPETKEWNGIVRELMEKRADLAVASMTINYARESVIDFTKPFMNLGIGILFKVPTSQPTRLFSFLNPLAVEIWLYVLASYVLVSFTLFVMARFSPYEWHSIPQLGYGSQTMLENQFTVSNSFWFATSTRIVGGIWWFFTLIIISSYTANLAAFLTVERMTTPIESAQDLAEQTEIAYGTLEGGSTMTFFRVRFKNRNLSENVALYGNPKPFRVCENLRRRNKKGYGIATPKGSPWRDKISLAILELQEKGLIQILYDKWWKNTGDVCNRDEKNKESKANALGIENIVAMLEFCWNVRRGCWQLDGNSGKRVSVWTRFVRELRDHCSNPATVHPSRPASACSCLKAQQTTDEPAVQLNIPPPKNILWRFECELAASGGEPNSPDVLANRTLHLPDAIVSRTTTL
nr:unnamed protein product [Callosobruchus analis]